MIRWITLSMALFVALAAHAQFRVMTDLGRVGMADLIVAGSVQKVVDAGLKSCVMTVRVSKVLKGTAGETVDIHHLVWMRGKAAEAFSAGEEFLFFLQETRDGYVLTRGMASLSPIANTETIANLVKNYPLTVTVAAPLGPIIIGKRNPVTITLKNNTDKPIGISVISLQGFYLAPEMDATLGKTIDMEANGHHVAIWQVTTIEPGKDYTANLEFFGEMPAAWRTKPPAGGMATDVKVRFCITVDLETPRKRDADTYYMWSPLIPTKVVLGESSATPVEK